jgi:hypothetical protein
MYFLPEALAPEHPCDTTCRSPDLPIQAALRRAMPCCRGTWVKRAFVLPILLSV